MIYKSYLIEKNIEILSNNITLFYGENSGLINDFKTKISFFFKDSKILRFSQDNIIKNEDIFINEINNYSLFETRKIFFIQDVNDKFLKFIDDLVLNLNDNKVFLFSGILDKKSKIRNYFEKRKETGVVPCYNDNEITIKNIITENLRSFSGLSPFIINSIAYTCGNDRLKLANEINKIKFFFNDKLLKSDLVLQLLNYKEDFDFNIIKEAALNGDNRLTNILLSSTVIETQKLMYYINELSRNLEILKKLLINKTSNLNEAIENLRPPIFWKDKPIYLKQAKIWNSTKISRALDKTYKAEIKVKTLSGLDNKIIVKKLIVDICNLANAA